MFCIWNIALIITLFFEIEMAEAGIAQKFYKNGIYEQPTETHTLTFKRADNLIQTREALTNHGAKNSTHIVEFSRISRNTVIDIFQKSLPSVYPNPVFNLD